MVMLCNTKYCRNVVIRSNGICSDCIKKDTFKKSMISTVTGEDLDKLAELCGLNNSGKEGTKHRDWCYWRMNPSVGNEETFCNCDAGHKD